MPKFICNSAIQAGEDKNFAEGDEVKGLPKEVMQRLLEIGVIEDVEPPKKEETKKEETTK